MHATEKIFKSISKEYITKSLLDLMQEKPFKKITISEITDKAEIARRTFYLNYSSKEDVLNEYFEILFVDFLETYNIKSQSLFDKANSYFKFWQNKYEFLVTLEKNQLFNSLIKIHVQKIVLQDIFNPKKDLGKILSDSEAKVLAIFNSNGLCAMLEYWVNNNMSESTEEMASLFCKIVSSN